MNAAPNFRNSIFPQMWLLIQGQAAETGLSHASLEAILNRCWHSQLDKATLSKSRRGSLWQHGHQLFPPWQRRPSAAVFKQVISVCMCLQTSIVCHSSFSEKVPVNQSHALCNTALNEIQWTDWVSDGWFPYIQPELSDGETLRRREEEVRVG